MEHQFHLSLPCISISKTKSFYVSIGGTVGRRSQNWIDINFYNHQITFTKSGAFNFEYKNYSFGGKVLPSFHFGVILTKDQWLKTLNKLKKANLNIFNEIEFLEGKTGAHHSFFLKDPNDYIIEFKCFNNPHEIFEA